MRPAPWRPRSSRLTIACPFARTSTHSTCCAVSPSAASCVAAWAFEHWPYLPPSLGGLLGVAGQAVGFPLLAIGYASSVALLVVDGRRFMSIAVAIVLIQIPLSAW